MKRLISFILALSMAMTFSGCSPKAEEPQTVSTPSSDAAAEQVAQPEKPADPPMDEYERAIWYGFAAPEEDADREISQREFADMLIKLVQTYRPEGEGEFEAIQFVQESNDEAIYRFHAAILLLYAAEAMDCATLPDGGYPTLNTQTADWNTFWSVDLAATGKTEEDFPISEAMTKAWSIYSNEPMSYFHGGINFAVSRLSRASGLPLLDVDNESYMRNMDKLTYREAAVSAVRLYESNVEIAARLSEDAASAAEAEKVLAMAVARRDAILSSATEVEYSGTAYYVANSGDDGADGRSPETAWATVARLNKADIASGDAVFFRRGDTWRGETIETRAGVTYSAYGEGAKPRFIASPENGADPAKWELLDGTDNIWVYKSDMLDCGSIVFDGERCAHKVLGYWNGEEYLNYLGPDNRTIGSGFTLEQQLSERQFDVKEQLDSDLYFFSEASGALPKTTTCYIGGSQAEEMLMYVSAGPLYLRCDKGNPGEVFESIEFIVPTPIIDALAVECVLDNLSIGLTGTGVSMNQNGVSVQNCELSWMGGCVVSYSFDSVDGNPPGVLRVGGALNTGASNVVMRDNYIHEIYEEALGVEAFRGRVESGDGNTENVLISGNLVYHAGSGLCYFNWDSEADPSHMFKNVVYEDNCLLFTGLHDWSSYNASCALGIDGGPNLQEGCAFRGNVFFGSRDTLVYINQLHPDTLPEFAGNTYIQFSGYPSLWLNEAETKYPASQGDTAVRDVLGDGDGKAVTLCSMRWACEFAE